MQMHGSVYKSVPQCAREVLRTEGVGAGRYDPYTHCFAGGIAGGFAAGLTTPLDVIKTLLQTRGNARDAELKNVSGLFQAAKIIHQREGYRGYFRGLKPRIITTMPSTAICW